MDKMSFPNYLRDALPAMTQAEISKRTGISKPGLSRLLTGEQKPTYKHILLLAHFLDAHPASLFEAAGDERGAEICRTLIPSGEDSGARQLCHRVRQLARRGLDAEVSQSLYRIELLWEVSRESFQELAEQMGCQAACLVADHLVQGDVLYRWECTEEQAERLAQDRQAPGWRRFSHTRPGMSLDLFMAGGRANRTAIRIGLSSWASALRKALPGGGSGGPA